MNLEELNQHLANLQSGLRMLRVLGYHEHELDSAIDDLFKGWNTFVMSLDKVLYPDLAVVVPITDEVERVALTKLGYPNAATWEQLAEAYYGKKPKNCLIERPKETTQAVFLFDTKEEALRFKLAWA